MSQSGAGKCSKPKFSGEYRISVTCSLNQMPLTKVHRYMVDVAGYTALELFMKWTLEVLNGL